MTLVVVIVVVAAIAVVRNANNIYPLIQINENFILSEDHRVRNILYAI